MLKYSLILGFCVLTTISFSQEEKEATTQAKPLSATKVVKVERLERASKLKPTPIKGKSVSVKLKEEGSLPEEKQAAIKKD